MSAEIIIAIFYIGGVALTITVLAATVTRHGRH
jgi:hypothetical protein